MSLNIQSLVASAVVAWLSAWWAVNLSLRKFRTENLWREKLEIYKQTIDAFYRLSTWSRNDVKFTVGGFEESDEHRQEFAETLATIEKLRAIGPFIISRNAQKIIDSCLKEVHGSLDPETPVHPNDLSKAIRSYRDNLITEAKADLERP